VNVLHRFDEVRLAQNEIGRFGLVDPHGDELHIDHLAFARDLRLGG
jgi:hypothetical protein